MTAARDVWLTTDRPVLLAVADLSIDGRRYLHSRDIAEAAGVEEPVVARSLLRLGKGRYIEHGDVLDGQGDHAVYVMGVEMLERGLREVEMWPKEDVGAEFMSALTEAISSEPDAGRRSRLEQLRDGVVAVGGQVFSGLIVEAVKRGTFGP